LAADVTPAEVPQVPILWNSFAVIFGEK
jgi:hypothetical protein